MWDGQAVAKVARGEGAAAAQAILAHCFHGNTYTLPCPGWFLAALTPEHALQYREQLTANAHEISWNPLSDCYPHAFPGIMIGPFGREFTATPKETWMTRQTLNEIRRVYTDGRGHVPMSEAFPLVMGDSIGFWDGDTLVIHTLYVPATRVGAEDTPDHSDELSAIESIKMTDPDTLTHDATIYDPLMLTQPWHGVHHYKRETSANDHVNYYTCDHNVFQQADGNTNVLIPGQYVNVARTFKDTTQIQADGGLGGGGGIDAVITTGAKILRDKTPPESAGGPQP